MCLTHVEVDLIRIPAPIYKVGRGQNMLVGEQGAAELPILRRQTKMFQGYSLGPVSVPPAILAGLLTSPHSHDGAGHSGGVAVVVDVVGGQNRGQKHPLHSGRK